MNDPIAKVTIGDSTAAILAGGRVYVHSLNAAEEAGNKCTLECLPNKDSRASATACALADGFLVVAHSETYMTYFSVAEKAGFCEYQHSARIVSLFPNRPCTKTVFQDKDGGVFLHNPCTETCVRVVKTDKPLSTVLWDVNDPTIFVCCMENEVTTYCYMPYYLQGETVMEVSDCPTSRTFERALSPRDGTASRSCRIERQLRFLGILTYQLPSGQLATECLKTHNSVVLEHKAPLERQIWEMLGKAALDQMDLELAEKAYQRIPRADILMWLNGIRQRSEEKLVAMGNIYAHMEDYDKAAESFLKSKQATLALDLLVDLQNWDRALILAQTLDPKRLAPLNLRYAHDLEAEGKHQKALRQYERARELFSRSEGHWQPERPSDEASAASPSERTGQEKENRGNRRTFPTPKVSQSQRICLAGIARCAIRIGEIQRGMQMAVDLGDRAVLHECASLLEDLKQFAEAASFHEKTGNTDKAVALYIQAHDFVAAAPLMRQIESPKLQRMFAKAKEEQRCFHEAMEAYARAKNYQAVVRILLHELGQEQEAFDLVRTTGSAAAAETAADFCRKQGRIKEAVAFLVAAGRVQEAMTLAEERDEMEAFVQSAGDKTEPDIQKRIAVYYEKQNLPVQAARHYANCGNAEKALDLYLNADVPAYDAAIELVSRFRQQPLTRTLQDFLEGVSDGVSKDPSFLHKLHMALGDHVEAAKYACKVARKEQEEGHYKVAHDILFRTWKDLEAEKLPLPQEIFNHFASLHSYILVRRLMRAGDLTVAAYLLERVLQNIHEFEAHAPSIMTSAILAFQRASMKHRAHKYSRQLLMKPGHRQDIPDKHKRTVEACARKPPSSAEADPEPACSPCPFCAAPLPDFTLSCDACQHVSPFCIATGKHLVAGDCAMCPHCKFPARATALQDLLSTEETCPMCEAALAPGEIVLAGANSFLRRANIERQAMCTSELSETESHDDEEMGSKATKRQEENIVSILDAFETVGSTAESNSRTAAEPPSPEKRC
ncbi:tetratricopeptide repeat-containing protein [Toxoplasma gondii MAS]|uniref:Tetratricopeptide repeat-containing protein n=1 Tax=Toxoplasma gondii MAS TaxID=943118 RepID=A0A086Q6V0_TOXGO|nr:tetratricopeptide repeat-containing protein [Toxoplasma gondii MAS]